MTKTRTEDQKKEIKSKKRIFIAEFNKAKHGGISSLPEHVVDMYSKSLCGPGKSKSTRDICIEAVERIPGTNRYRIAIKKPMFEDFTNPLFILVCSFSYLVSRM